MNGRVERGLTYRGRPVFTYYVAPCKDGIIFGVSDKRLGDVHLTLISKDGKLRSHITDSRKLEKSEIYPWGTQFHPKMLVGRVERIVKRWVRPITYNPQKKAWVIPEKLSKDLVAISSESRARMTLSAETYLRQMDVRKWKRVLIQDLLGKGKVAITDKPTWSMVFPIDSKRMMFIPIQSALRLQSLVAREYGFARYFEYISGELSLRLPERSCQVQARIE